MLNSTFISTPYPVAATVPGASRSAMPSAQLAPVSAFAGAPLDTFSSLTPVLTPPTLPFPSASVRPGVNSRSLRSNPFVVGQANPQDNNQDNQQECGDTDLVSYAHRGMDMYLDSNPLNQVMTTMSNNAPLVESFVHELEVPMANGMVEVLRR